MGKPRTIDELVKLLPVEAQRAKVYRGKTLGQLLLAGEEKFLSKLTNVVCTNVDAKAAHWSVARKIHWALVAGGLEAEKTGITPKRFTIRSGSPGAQAKRARQQGDRDVGDASQSTLDGLFRRGTTGSSSEGDEDAAEAEASEADGGSDVPLAQDDGSARDIGEGDSDEKSSEEDGGPAAGTAVKDAKGVESSSSSSEEEPKPTRRIKAVKAKSPMKPQMLGRSRAASAAASRESADRARMEATWLSSIKELTSQVTNLSRYVNTQSEALVLFSDKLLAVEKQTVATAAEAAKAPEKAAEILAERAAAANALSERALAAKALADKVTADKAAAAKTVLGKAAADKAAADKAAADKAAADKAAADKATSRTAAATRATAARQVTAETGTRDGSEAAATTPAPSASDAVVSGAPMATPAGPSSGEGRGTPAESTALVTPGEGTQVRPFCGRNWVGGFAFQFSSAWRWRPWLKLQLA